MNIDQWAQQASTDMCGDGETPEQYAARLAELRALSARNDIANPWSHPHRKAREEREKGLGEVNRQASNTAAAIWTAEPEATQPKGGTAIGYRNLSRGD